MENMVMDIKDNLYTETFKDLEKFYNKKKILVTGHTGFKGSWLTEVLVMLGANVTGYALKADFPSLYDTLDIDEKINSVIGDIRDLEHLKSVFEKTEPELVIHLAAQPIVIDSYKKPVYTYETNVMGTVNILECIRLSKSVKSFLNVTTDKVYDNKEIDKGYVEEDILDGYDPYSNSKSCSELVTHSYKRSFLTEQKIAVSTARAGNVIGGGDFAPNRIVPDCARAAMKKEDVIIRNPYSIRPYQHVLEPLYIYLMILKRQYENREVFEGNFNVGPEDRDCINTEKLVSYFKEFWKEGFNYKIQSNNTFHEAGFLKLNCDKLKKVYSWKPVYDIKKAVEETAKWYKAYDAGEDMEEVTKNQIKEFFTW